MFSNDFTPKKPLFFECEKCNYKSSNKKDFNRHIETRKHLSNENQGFSNDFIPNYPKKYDCICGKNYMDYSGLWRHKKKCNVEIEKKQNVSEISPELVMELIKDNKELRQLVLEQNKTITELAKTQVSQINNNNNNNNNNNFVNNSHNKTFNLNVFLNETCKDAMNITDFVDSIKLQLSDLEKVGELGYVEGISNIIVKNLKEMDITERPVHCTDSKREVMYIKDENKWEKDNEDKNKLKKAIKRVANKNIKLIQDFKAKYPDCIYSESKKSDQYNKLIIEAFELENPEKQEKVIKKIAKEVIIEK